MPLTASERSALKWLIAVIVLGSGAKLYGQWRNRDSVSPESALALSAQLLAVDSVQKAARGGRGKGRTVRARRSETEDSERRAGRSPKHPETRAGTTDSRMESPRPTLALVDLDLADAASMERLPRIGPALAARIVADRAERGPFGSLRGLERVRGIGPKLAQLLAAHVTFSGTPRPSPEQH
jgi:DNA uptake protein ComE-like DNA-binding protein